MRFWHDVALGRTWGVIRAFESFYHNLRRNFRCGQVAGHSLRAANNSVQGYPRTCSTCCWSPFIAKASLKTWESRLGALCALRQLRRQHGAGGQKQVGGACADRHLPALGSVPVLRVSKVQERNNTGLDHEVQLRSMVMKTVSYFRMVDVALGEEELLTDA